jgi:hypothetical protein
MICQEVNEKFSGIEVRNYCLDNLPAEIAICKLCAEKLAIGFMTGKVNLFKIFSSLKLGKG